MGKSDFERTLAWGARDAERRYRQRTHRERRGQQEDRRQPQQPSAWTPRGGMPPFVGVVEGTDEVVSFKAGPRGTLISDGDFSDDNTGFRDHHNHYGERSEAPGSYFAEDRGYYTGPYH